MMAEPLHTNNAYCNGNEVVGLFHNAGLPSNQMQVHNIYRAILSAEKVTQLNTKGGLICMDSSVH